MVLCEELQPALYQREHLVNTSREFLTSSILRYNSFSLFLTTAVWNRDPVTTATAFFAEAFGTGVLAFVIFSLTNSNNDVAKNEVFIPPLIGATVGGLIAVIAPLTQAGFNPARDFGPRIVAWLAGPWCAVWPVKTVR